MRDIKEFTSYNSDEKNPVLKGGNKGLGNLHAFESAVT